MDLIWLIPICFGAYIIGNINFSVMISRRKNKDIRAQGSGNPGATNMLRSFGFKWALAIFLLDASKGAVAAFVGRIVFGWDTDYGMIALFAVGFSAVIGHCFPVFYKFKGGKGVSTIIGVFAIANPIVAVIGFFAGFIYGLIWEYASMASLIAISIPAIYHSITSSHLMSVTIMLVGFYFFICFMHRKNIYRLLLGNENKASMLAKLKKKSIARKQQQWAKEFNAKKAEG